MEKMLVLLFCLILTTGSVFVEAAWGDIDTGEKSAVVEDIVIQDVSTEEVLSNENVRTSGSREGGVAETTFTKYFYFAIGLGVFVFFVLLYIIYRFVAGPSVRWKKPKPVKQ